MRIALLAVSIFKRPQHVCYNLDEFAERDRAKQRALDSPAEKGIHFGRYREAIDPQKIDPGRETRPFITLEKGMVSSNPHHEFDSQRWHVVFAAIVPNIPRPLASAV